MIDPSLRRIARLLPRRRPVITDHRRGVRMMLSVLDRFVACGDVHVVQVSATASLRVHRPAQLTAGAPAVLWIHGGGYVIGSATMDDRQMRSLAAELGALVASVEYRLAPEHRFPAAFDDCCAALGWLATHPEVDPRRIAVVGASAGGGLAAAVAARSIGSNGVPLAGQVLIYPMLDDRTVDRPAGRDVRCWTPGDNAAGWRAYLGSPPGAPDVDPYAAPARRVDMTGLPPAWLGVGTADLFYDEGLEYARRLTAAGVDTQLEIAPGAFHAFDSIAPKSLVAQKFTASWIEATRRFLYLD